MYKRTRNIVFLGKRRLTKGPFYRRMSRKNENFEVYFIRNRLRVLPEILIRLAAPWLYLSIYRSPGKSCFWFYRSALPLWPNRAEMENAKRSTRKIRSNQSGTIEFSAGIWYSSVYRFAGFYRFYALTGYIRDTYTHSAVRTHGARVR